MGLGRAASGGPGAAARHRSRTRVPRILFFLDLFLFESVAFPPSFFSFLRSDFTKKSLSDLRFGGNIDFKPRYSDCRRSRDAENIVRF